MESTKTELRRDSPVATLGSSNNVEGEVTNNEPDDIAAESEAVQPCELAEEIQAWDLKDALLATLVVLAGFYTIYFTRSLLFPITLAVLLNLVFKPVVLRLQKLHIPAPVSAVFILVSFAGVVAVGTWLLWEPATARIRQMTSREYLDRVAEKIKPIQEPIAELDKVSAKVDEMTSGTDDPEKVQITQPKLGSMLSVTGGFVGSTLIILVLVFFLLAAGDRFLEKLVGLMPSFKDKRRIVELTREVQHRVSVYLFTITVINIALGVAIGFGMWVIGLPNPVLWGVMAAFLNYIPFAGAALGAIVVLLEGFIAFDDLGRALLAPTLYITLNAIEANFVTPAMLGKSVSLNPVMIVLAIFFWGWLWGVGGVLLAVPLLVMLKICFDHSQTMAPLGSFMER